MLQPGLCMYRADLAETDRRKPADRLIFRTGRPISGRQAHFRTGRPISGRQAYFRTGRPVFRQADRLPGRQVRSGRKGTKEEMDKIQAIAHIHTDFPEKFGIPRQSGLVEDLEGRIVFEPEFRNPDAVRGLEQFSHVWLLWKFSENEREGWQPTVRPPRLGGNTRLGVFATRSPFRPNGIGLSCVRLKRVELTEKEGPVLIVLGADLMDGTPILDIKPYIPLADCHPEASEGYTKETGKHALLVEFPEELLSRYPEEKRGAAAALLSQDPRPGYSSDPERVYGVAFAGYDIRFRVRDGVLTVCGLEPRGDGGGESRFRGEESRL